MDSYEINILQSIVDMNELEHNTPYKYLEHIFKT